MSTQQNLTDLQRDLAIVRYLDLPKDSYKIIEGDSVFIKVGVGTWTTTNFHRSLDALLPVIERIEDEWVGRGVMLVEIVGVQCQVSFNDEGEIIYAKYDSSSVKTKVEAIYKAVSDYCFCLTKNKSYVYKSTTEVLKNQKA